MFVAGPLAERHLTGDPMDPLISRLFIRNDWHQVQYRYDALQPDVDLETLVERGRALVERRWRDIEFVATALIERHTLTAAQVIEQIGLAQAD